VLPTCDEQEFLAELKREGYTCDMLILSNRIQRLTFFAVFSVGWFNVALSRADEALSGVKKAVLVLHGDRLSIPAVKATDQGLMAALSRGQSQDVEIFSEYLDLSRFPMAKYGDDIVRYLRTRYGARKPDVVIAVGFALELALAHRDELFAGVPIVFANVDHRDVEEAVPPNVSGLWMAWDYRNSRARV
jgi:hypothetical protein